MAEPATARWIDTTEGLDALVAELADAPRLAIDTEFHRERTYWPQCALVQIGWGTGEALIDPLAVDITPIGALLTGRTVVMHAAGQDLEVFQHSVGVVPDDLFDTQIAASFLGMSSIGLAPLVNKLLDVHLPKADRLTDWLARPLSEDAKRYAQSDVVHLFELHDLMTEALEQRGRMAWVRSECDALVERSLAPSDPTTAWWRVKEARRLKGTAAGVAQALAAWREAHAAEVDRPLRSVLPDLALAGIAQRPPSTVEDLVKIRGLRDRGIPKAIRDDVLDAVAAGKALAADEVVYPVERPVPAELRSAVPLLMSWVSQRARELDLDPAVLATRGDLEGFLRDDPDNRLATGWRAEALATDIGDLLEGRAGLSFAKGEGLVLRPLDP
ncbi:HRDC domain-containing protein [Acidimicrobiia bacterium EGI L10123]|uniref:ribonuclease D n=1 Tax=Salinilacustrithrix flava TaxID=2957203 RepID=UPI003D7C168A|nr:HRDC domain-containing protein [Acidimicrobiia bacterium EGI L10123]